MAAINVFLKDGTSEIVHPVLFKSYRIIHLKEIKGWEKTEVDDYYFKFKIVKVN